MTAPLLEIRDLTLATAAGTTVVDAVSLTVARGEVVALIGESGSGKTTIGLSALAYCRPGLHFAGGQVRLHGQDILVAPAAAQRALRGAGVAYLAQSAAATFNPALRIGAQVTEVALRKGGTDHGSVLAHAVELYRALDLPDPERLGRLYPHQVSGGQLQRLMAAMALSGRPELLILDEPTTALDVTTQIEVLRSFKRVIANYGTAALYISHDLAVVAQIADRVVVLRDGRLREEGPVDQIIGAPRDDYTRSLIAAASRTPAQRRISPAPPPAPPFLTLREIAASYNPARPDTAPVIADIDLDIAPGEVLAVVGESGCGKSTLGRVIAGLLPAYRGELRLDGVTLPAALEDRSREQLRRVQIAFQMADTALNPRHRVGDVIGRPLEFYLGLRGRPRRDRVVDLLAMVELPPELADRPPASLSGGQKQRVNLARALAANPEVIVCDEVTSALDTIVSTRVLALLDRLRSETGVALVFISHDLSAVAGFADRIAVLYAGRIVETGAAHQVLTSPRHPYTQLLAASVPQLRPGWLETVGTSALDPGAMLQVEPRRGCAFFPRCAQRLPGLCEVEQPAISSLSDGRRVACHALGQTTTPSPQNPGKVTA